MMLAHDIGTPISIARSYLSGIQSRGGPVLLEAARRVEEELVRVDEQCRKALEALRLESARLPLHMLTVDAARLMRHVARQLRALAPGRTVLSVGRAPAEIICDPDALAEALINLGDKAIKYSAADDKIRLRMRESEDAVRFVVEDSGPGMKPDQFARPGEPFRRGRQDKPGTGLGIFVARRIAESHGGRLVMTSTPGAGSTFAIEVPKGS